MSRPLLPSAVLALLALACNVRPRFMDDCPKLADANLAARVPVAINLRTVAAGQPLGMDMTMAEVVERVAADPAYLRLSRAAYGSEPRPEVVTKAIASSMRSLVSGSSRYGRHLAASPVTPRRSPPPRSAARPSRRASGASASIATSAST